MPEINYVDQIAASGVHAISDNQGQTSRQANMVATRAYGAVRLATTQYYRKPSGEWNPAPALVPTLSVRSDGADSTLDEIVWLPGHELRDRAGAIITSGLVIKNGVEYFYAMTSFRQTGASAVVTAYLGAPWGAALVAV
ncbi:MAG: hypothetical protein ABW007_19350 [Chitinophagaceae bacterium]